MAPNQIINPIVPGFAPDPSVVKVEGWYFLVNSTFHMFPGLPIYASQDLFSWKHIGNAIHRPGQLSLARSDTGFHPSLDGSSVMLATGGLYAPTIRYHSGVFYVVCTNIIHDGGPDGQENFIVSTRDIWSGHWSDPVYFSFAGIDPSILFDDDGKTYIQGSAAPGPMTKINLFQVDLATGEKLSEERTIWAGTGGIYPEGPHIYKLDGWYYLMISEGGTHEDHMLTMARSKNVWGPYEPCPHNPILTAAGTDEYIQYTGHCDLVQDDAGQWWGTCLGVRKDKGGRFVMGRETFLTSGHWNGGWLSFDRVKMSPEDVVPARTVEPLSAAPGVDYLYIRDPNLSNYRIGQGSSVTLTASPVDLAHLTTSPTFVGKRQRLLSGKSSVTIAPPPPAAAASWAEGKLRCGIAVYKDEHRYVRIYYDARDSVVVFELINNAQKISRREHRPVKAGAGGLSLRIAYTEQEYRLLYSAGTGSSDDDWDCLAVADTLEMTDPDFVGPVIGVFAVADASGLDVEMRDLQID